MDSAEDSTLAGASLKQLKEAFVSNLHGSSMVEIAALSAVVPAFIILRQLSGLFLQRASRGADTSSNGQANDDSISAGCSRHYGTVLLNDFIFVAIPTLACLTVATILSRLHHSVVLMTPSIVLALIVLSSVRSALSISIPYSLWQYNQSRIYQYKVLSDGLYIITGVSIFLAVVGVVFLRRLKIQKDMCSPRQVKSKEMSPRKTGFLSSFRFTMMLVTCVSILAVDFKVFPRRYAKTETYGTGLMDVGVGSFVVANGLVSRQARNLPPAKYGGVLRNTSPLLVLGFARLVLTKGVDYQEHVAEYGVHWNFFFTLAAVALLTSIIHVPAAYCGSLAVLILAGYQASLSYGLNKYLLSSERGPGLVSLNKEGIYSIFGYWSLYLISVRLGNYLSSLSERFPSQGPNVSSNGKAKGVVKWWVVVDIWLLDAIFWLLTIFVDEFIERVSRRMCNLAYVLFVLAQNLEVIAIFLTAESLLPSKVMPLLRIFDNNMLATFLWANILTGLVNMSMETIFASTPVAMSALFSYLAFLVGGMGIVDFLGVKLKFW